MKLNLVTAEDQLVIKLKTVKTDFPLFPWGIFETTESIQLLLI